MQNQVLIVVVAALTMVSVIMAKPEVVKQVGPVDPVVVVDSVVGADPAVAASRNLNVGSITARDRLLYSNYFYKAPMANAIQSQDITYRGNSSIRISAIQVNEVGYTQFATARITAGGVGRNTVTIRLSTARSYGYYFSFSIWGR